MIFGKTYGQKGSMKGRGHNQPRPVTSIKGFRVGDRVVTSLGRPATITGLRLDGYLDAAYDDRSPTQAAVILQPETLRKVK